MTPSPLNQLINAGESHTQEFKSSFDKACIETLVAFANAKGGRVLVGVSNAGRVQGITLGKESLNEWLVQIKAATSPSIIPDLEAHTLDGKTLVVISVAEFPVKPVSTKGRYYKRVANTNQALNPSEISDLYMQSLQLSWDAYPAHNATLADLSTAKIDAFVQQINAGGRFALGRTTGTEALQKLNYISQGQPTWAAMLLFAKEPMRHHIHIGRFKTPSLIIDDRQITDTLFEAVDQAMRFIVSYVPVAFEITGAVRRTERFAYPLPALREALLNAVVHRDYKDGSDIQIKILDNSISIFSPGRLYDGLTLAELQQDHYRSRLRNKLVAEAFSSPPASKNTAAASSASAKHCSTTPMCNSPSKNSAAAFA
jgi:ATP-dependent DNA helicase RecG